MILCFWSENIAAPALLSSSTVLMALGATGTNTNTVTFGWTAVLGAVAYQVWYSTSTGTQAAYYVSTTNSYTLIAITGTSGTIPTVNTTGSVNISGTTISTSTTTGALVVAGGAGIAGNVYAGAFYGSGTGLTSVTGANVTGTVANATYAVASLAVIALFKAYAVGIQPIKINMIKPIPF